MGADREVFSKLTIVLIELGDQLTLKLTQRAGRNRDGLDAVVFQKLDGLREDRSRDRAPMFNTLSIHRGVAVGYVIEKLGCGRVVQGSSRTISARAMRGLLKG
mgnify:CR=1 FL=1